MISHRFPARSAVNFFTHDTRNALSKIIPRIIRNALLNNSTHNTECPIKNNSTHKNNVQECKGMCRSVQECTGLCRLCAGVDRTVQEFTVLCSSCRGLCRRAHDNDTHLRLAWAEPASENDDSYTHALSQGAEMTTGTHFRLALEESG